MVYIPIDIVDIIVDHSIGINARHHMKTIVLPDLLNIHQEFMTFRCEQCSEEGMICTDCAHYHDYKTGPGHYCGKKYIVDDMMNTENLPIYMDNISMWSNGMDMDVYHGGELGRDHHSIRLKYDRDKYTKGTIEHLNFMGIVHNIDATILRFGLEMGFCVKPMGYKIDHANIKSFCRAKQCIENFDILFNLWLECMYET